MSGREVTHGVGATHWVPGRPRWARPPSRSTAFRCAPLVPLTRSLSLAPPPSLLRPWCGGIPSFGQESRLSHSGRGGRGCFRAPARSGGPPREGVATAPHDCASAPPPHPRPTTAQERPPKTRPRPHSAPLAGTRPPPMARATEGVGTHGRRGTDAPRETERLPHSTLPRLLSALHRGGGPRVPHG